jgi:thiol-disulfide isomerase/thioredoxin
MKTIIYFKAKWCGPCATAKPQLEQLVRERGIDLKTIDVEEEPKKANLFNVNTVPTFIVYGDGGKYLGTTNTVKGMKELLDPTPAPVPA